MDTKTVQALVDRLRETVEALEKQLGGKNPDGTWAGSDDEPPPDVPP